MNIKRVFVFIGILAADLRLLERPFWSVQLRQSLAILKEFFVIVYRYRDIAKVKEVLADMVTARIT